MSTLKVLHLNFGKISGDLDKDILLRVYFAQNNKIKNTLVTAK